MTRLLKSGVWFVAIAALHLPVANANPRVRVQTNLGAIVIEIDADRAPLTAANFLQYVKEGQYTSTVFHRVVAGFVIQGGGYTPQGELKPTRAPVANESGNGLSNTRGTVGMARSNVAHSANCQFYVNLSDNPALDPQPGRWGYAVFGHVIEGMNIADSIGNVSTGSVKPFTEDAPLKSVVIEKIDILSES